MNPFVRLIFTLILSSNPLWTAALGALMVTTPGNVIIIAGQEISEIHGVEQFIMEKEEIMNAFVNFSDPNLNTISDWIDEQNISYAINAKSGANILYELAARQLVERIINISNHHSENLDLEPESKDSMP